MIQLDVKSYCAKCQHFDPYVAHRPEITFGTEYEYECEAVGNTIIRCADHEKCYAIYRFLMDDMSKEDKNA